MTTTDYVPTTRKATTVMATNESGKLRLLQVALSRARMRQPQVIHTPEAHRSARQIAMQARDRAAYELGGRLG
jgi:hypothetical protein